MKNLIKNLKEENQDFEFYPTTNEIINHLNNDIRQEIESSYSHNNSLLEIGAGNGKVLNQIEGIGQKYAIEKSEILINQLEKDIIVVGTDFHHNTLMDKKVGFVFCNPPYSEFEEWTKRIVKESFAKIIYLVIPQRWEKSIEINEEIKKRGASFEILGDFDFLQGDRQARAKVHLLKIDLRRKHSQEGNDPFNLWFEEEFKINCDKKETKEYEEKERKREEIKNEITKSDLVKTLTTLYERDLQKLIVNYKQLGEIDQALLKELNVSIEGVREALKEKIKGLKYLYWKELFDNLTKITSRLTYKKRTRILEKLQENTSIDFTESNIYAVAIWVIKNANQYFDEQLVEVYKDLTSRESIKNYKSNQRTWEKDDWRFNQEEKSHYSLDYRIIHAKWGSCFDTGYSGNALTYSTVETISDILTIANNLGFVTKESDWRNTSTSAKFIIEANEKTLVEIRCHKNGNIHFKFDQEFMRSLNVEASRILGWIKSPKEAQEEFGEKEAEKFFKSSFIFTNNAQLLLN